MADVIVLCAVVSRLSKGSLGRKRGVPVDVNMRMLAAGTKVRPIRSTRHRDGHDSASAGQETFLFGKWLGGGPPITAARLRPCPAPSTDVPLWDSRDNVLSRAEAFSGTHGLLGRSPRDPRRAESFTYQFPHRLLLASSLRVPSLAGGVLRHTRSVFFHVSGATKMT